MRVMGVKVNPKVKVRVIVRELNHNRVLRALKHSNIEVKNN